MTTPTIEWRYPLAWPQGRPRTPKPVPALFRHGTAKSGAAA